MCRAIGCRFGSKTASSLGTPSLYCNCGFWRCTPNRWLQAFYCLKFQPKGLQSTFRSYSDSSSSERLLPEVQSAVMEILPEPDIVRCAFKLVRKLAATVFDQGQIHRSLGSCNNGTANLVP